MSGDETELPEFVAGLIRIGVEQLGASIGLPADQATRGMQAVADAVCTEFARRSIYVPVAYDPRNREIAAKYRQSSRAARACTHGRIVELAREYALTTRQVYSILAEARQADFQARQGSLDLGDTPTA